jgi:hypothetical protein
MVASCAPAVKDIPCCYPTPWARDAQYRAWTRHYEQKMGLAAHPVEFATLPGDRCGMVELDPYSGRIVVVFDVAKGCAPREVALHESCHLRYAHLLVPLTDAQRHAEVATCARHYR